MSAAWSLLKSSIPSVVLESSTMIALAPKAYSIPINASICLHPIRNNSINVTKGYVMSFKNFIYNYGEKVPGYDVGMVNENEVRATAGILFLLGMIVLFVGIGYNHIMVARIYLAFIFIDMTVRIINPRYSPALLFGRMFIKIKNQNMSQRCKSVLRGY